MGHPDEQRTVAMPRVFHVIAQEEIDFDSDRNFLRPSRAQVVRDPDIVPIGMLDTPNNIHIGHATSRARRAVARGHAVRLRPMGFGATASAGFASGGWWVQ
jgi:hypothetical protein